MKKVKVIINPAAGPDVPVLSTLNDVFNQDVEWDVSVTHAADDARRFAERAVADGFDVVAVYGGDGTVSEVARVLAGESVPLAILPGGTGNGVARFMNLPLHLHEAAALVTGDFAVRPIDLGRVNGRTFILRADLGFMAATDQATSRIAKDHLGKWAYALTSFRHRDLLRPVHYEMTVDGEEVEVEAVVILIVNIGAVAFGHKALVHDSTPDDGLLDVLALTRTDIVALAEVVSSVVFGNRTPMLRWQVKKAEIRAAASQAMALDGELVENTPATVEVLPHTLGLVVPAPPEAPRTRERP